MKTILSALVCLLLFYTCTVACAPRQTVAILEKVKLQLKWQHQFQFAGYYAAKEQGFYAKAGLDVDIFEREPDKDVVAQVVSGNMDYAVGDSGILSYYARGEPIVALAAIFQHNPLVFISKKSSGIISPYEMKGKRIMLDLVGAGDSVLRAVLTEARLTDKNYIAIKQSFKNEDLLNNKVDVMSAYLSDEVFYYQQKKIKINIINPQSYGIDFYGDILFTSQHELLKHSKRAEKFRAATLQGWQYALDHTEELIQLIRQKYHSRLSVKHLRFEAEATRRLIVPDVIALGQIEPGRMRKVAEVYAQLQISKPLSDKKLIQFIYPFKRNDDKPLIVGSEEDYPPFALGKTDATAGGFTVELWRAVAKEEHLNSKIKVMPFHQALKDFKEEKIDVLINLAQSDERRQFAEFSVPHFVSKGAVFVRDDQRGIHSEADLQNKHIIVLNADLAQDYAVAKGWQKQLIRVDTAEKGLQFLAAGYYDAMLLSQLTGKQTLEKLQLNNIKMLEFEVDFPQKFSFAVHKGDTELLAKINDGLALIKAKGIYDQLYEKWFGVYEEKALLPRLLKVLVPIVVLFLFILWGLLYHRQIERDRAQKRLALRERHLRAILEASTSCVKLVARDGKLLSINPAGLAAIGVESESSVRNQSVYPLIAPEYRAAYQAFNESICDGNPGSMEFEMISLIGVRCWMDTSAVPFKLENGEVVQLAFSQEITKRKEIEMELRIAAKVFESHEGMFITDLNGVILKVNQAFTKITGYTAEEAVGKTPKLLNSGRHEKEFYRRMWKALKETGAWEGEVWNRRKNGQVYPEQQTITAVKNHQDDLITHYVATLTDITERKAAEKTIHQLAFYDPLTQLPNRRLLQERIGQSIKVSLRTGKQMAVLMLDLDRFKAVNDKLGHSAGDELLQQVAKRIKACLREADTVARLGGDEFVVVIEDVSYTQQIAVVANNIIAALNRPFFLLSGHYEACIGTSVGIAIYPHDGNTIEVLIDNADIALYRAKNNGRGCFAYFTDEGAYTNVVEKVPTD